MTRINLKEEVQSALAIEWSSFAERHPLLAEVIDQQILVEQTTADLSADPEYQRAIAEVAALGTATVIAAEIIRAFVKDWLRRLV